MTPKNTNHKVNLSASQRDGSESLSVIRREGFIPAVVYGKGLDSISLKVPAKDFSKALKEAGESTLVYLEVGKDQYPTIIHDISRDPVSGNIMHADFYKVNLTEKISANVPVLFEGESSAVKDLGGIFVRNVNEIEVKALPQDLPHEIKVDISVLKAFGDQILAKDLNLPKGVELMIEPDAILALVQEPMSEEELKASLEGETKTVEDVEVIEKEKKEEVTEDSPAEEKKEE